MDSLYHLHAYPGYELGLEAVQYQYDIAKADAVTGLLEPLMKQGFTQKLIDQSDLRKALVDIIGVPLKIIVTDDFEAMVTKLTSTPDHPFATMLLEYYGISPSDVPANAFRKANGKSFPITIDRQHGKILGYPDKPEYEHPLVLGRFLFNLSGTSGDLTPRQAMGIILHELGHIFTWYEWMIRLTRTNALLSSAADQILKIHDQNERRTLVNRLTLKTGIGRGQEEAITKATSLEAIQSIYLNESIKSARSDMGGNIYNIREMEALADQYAVRMGYGLEVANGLMTTSNTAALAAKLEYDPEGPNYALIAFLVLGTVVFTPLIVVGGVFLLIAKAAGIAYTLFSGSSLNMGRYDSDRRRLSVIRNEMIGRMKNAPAGQSRAIMVAQIDAVTRLIELTPEESNFLGFISSVFGPSSRGASRNMRTQQLLEDLSQSVLNVAAAKL